MINIGDIIKENIKEHNRNFPCIADHPYRILIVGGSGSGKTNSLFNFSQQPWMNRGNKSASWNDKLDLEVYFWFYNIE